MTALYLRTSSPHFAPSVETVSFYWAPAPEHKIDSARIEITDRNGKVVVSHKLQAPSLRRFVWDGEDTRAPSVMGPTGRIAQYVDPLRSPFTVKVHARLSKAARPLPPPPDLSTGPNAQLQRCTRPAKRPLPPIPGPEVTATCTVKVLYRDVVLRPMTWLEAYEAVSQQVGSAFPAGASTDVQAMWVQYRLNELGYPAGAIEDPPDPSVIVRALFRYALAHPDLPKIREFDTIDSWTWEDEWEAEYGDLDAILAGTTPSGKALRDALVAGDNPRRDVVEQPAALQDRTKSSRIILDHDTYYINKDFSKPDAHADYDEQFLNPITLPLVAHVRLVSASDATATGAGVDAPRAVGEAAVEWVVFDPPEDMSVVPTPVTADVPFRSQARRFLRAVQEEFARAPDDPLDAHDNCPQPFGGAAPSAYKDMTGYYRPVTNVSTSRSPGGRRFVSVACTDPKRREIGRAAVFFTGSHIAGDNYVLQARLTFDGVAQGNAIETDHKALPGLAQSFAPTQRWMPGDPLDSMVAQSGVLTIWRRHHVACELWWGPPTLPAINWFPIIDNFRAAHVILVPPPRAPEQLATFFTDAASKAEIARAIVESASLQGATKTEFDARKAHATCRTDGMYPLPLRTLVDFEGSPLHTGAPTTDPAERFERYAKYLEDQNQNWPTYDTMVEVSLAIRKALDVAKVDPGVAIVRAQYMPEPDWAALLPPDVFRATEKQRAAFAFTKAMATGMDHGVVFLDSINARKYADIFFVTHEISHCLFGSHAFEQSSLDDHDLSDGNCIMYYGSNNDGMPYGWGARSAPSEYAVRVELRKANTRDPSHDSYGSIDAKGFVAKDPKTYEFHGDAAALQKALHGLKFTPSRRLGKDYEIEIELGAVAMRPVTAPRRLPFTTVVVAGDGSVRPFADVTVKPADPKETEPRFCGKCLLKLRGWRVRDLPRGQKHLGKSALPDRSPVIPVNPTMHFVGYAIKTGTYMSDSSGKPQPVELAEGKKDPLDPRIALGPYAFLHKHRLTWESSNGRLKSLANVRTREWVKFRAPTQDPPFTAFADPDQEFTQEGGSGDTGYAQDDHSVGWPALVVASPLRSGTLVGEQWYQYSLDGTEWHNIEGAAFLLEKRVHFDGKHWLLTFKKTNWAPHNTKPFSFEVSYIIGTPPKSEPMIVANQKQGTPAQPYRSVGAIITQSGAKCAERMANATIDTTLEELKRKGWVPS